MFSGTPLRRLALRGLVTRPLLAVLCLCLALPAQASWLGRLFGHDDRPAASSAPAAEPSAATPGDIPGNDQDDAPALRAESTQADSSNSKNSNTTAVIDTLEAEAADDDDDTAQDAEPLPNVEESLLGDVDESDDAISADLLAANGDLWSRLRDGMQMDSDIDNERIAVQRNWYLRNPDYLNRMALRASRYLHYTVSEAERRGLPTELALLPVIESAYDPFAYSHAHAAGMWQFIPGTARIMGVKQNSWFDGRRDVLESTRAGYDFLSMLYEKFGDWQLALAAYNAGPGAVQRAINRNQAAGLPTDFWSLRLPAETRAYVPRFLAMVQIIKRPETYGLALRPVLNQPFFRVISLQNQVDITQAAKIAGISLKEMYQLNAGFNRWATDPNGPHRLLVPAALPQDFEEQIRQLPVPQQTTAETYRVRKGDTLYGIARRFNVTAAEIRKLNHLKSDRVAVGRELTLSRQAVNAEFAALNAEMHLNRSSQATRNSSGSVRKTYVVRRGDTLSSIARRHGVSSKQLARWNGISTRSHIRAGQRLSLQTKAASGKSAQRLAGKGSKNKVKKIRYEVKKGDTLSSIGRRYKVSVTQIKRWNGSSKKLRPGQDLVLYVARNDRH